MPDRAFALDALAGKLNSIGSFSDANRAALEGLAIDFRTFAAGQDIFHEGERPAQCCILVFGLTASQKSLPQQQSQYVALHVPGDIINLQSLNMPVLDHTLTALTNVEVACIPCSHLRDLMDRSPSLNSILWRSTLIEAAVTRQWLSNMVQRSASERVAHLFCEMYSRSAAVGLHHKVDGARVFPLPLTQVQLGRAAGLSAVHVNRSLQDLRGRQLIRSAGGFVTILNWTGLKGLAQFNASYLGLLPGFNEPA